MPLRHRILKSLARVGEKIPRFVTVVEKIPSVQRSGPSNVLRDKASTTVAKTPVNAGRPMGDLCAKFSRRPTFGLPTQDGNCATLG